MTACPESRSVFDLSAKDEFVGLREVNSALREVPNADPAPACQEGTSLEDGQKRDSSLAREVSDKMVCSACKCPFTQREEQIEHYKLDWHRFNLRLKMTGLPPLTAEEFERKTGAGDLSSISGSESDSEEEDSDSENGGTSGNVTGTDNESSLGNHRLSSKLVFQSDTGEYLSVYRCILQGKSSEEQDPGSALRVLNKKTVWVILMTGGGHFAGAVFEGKQVLQHKTFHRYTVRAKRGTAQGLRDSQNRSHAPKSAGAALRRHNEAALVKDIQDLLVTWAEHLKEASAIFIRAPSYNRSIFFGGRAAPLDKKDPRIRTLPFATRRATFREVQRVHGLLSTVHVHGKDTDLSAIFSPSKKAWKKTVKARAQVNTDQEEAEVKVESSDEEEDGGDIRLEMVELTLGTLDLRESEVCPSRSRRRRRRKKDEAKVPNEDAELQEVKPPETPPAEDAVPETRSKNRRRRKPLNKKQLDGAADDTSDYALKDALFTACKAGDMDTLHTLLQPPAKLEAEEQPESSPADVSSVFTLLNKPIDSSGFTLLHAATAAAQKAVVKLLLDVGADPACRDNKGRTPYIVAPDKDTRNVYRTYMGENPDKYDYTRAQVPGPLTAEIESKKMEKKKAQKAQKKQRDKEQKVEKRKQELEAEEKQRFASLTDREKRALAAERRLAEQVAAQGASISNVKRCWQCGESLLGKVPFHYLEFSFCSPRCVQEHRKSHASQGKT